MTASVLIGGTPPAGEYLHLDETAEFDPAPVIPRFGYPVRRGRASPRAVIGSPACTASRISPIKVKFGLTSFRRKYSPGVRGWKTPCLGHRHHGTGDML